MNIYIYIYIFIIVCALFQDLFVSNKPQILIELIIGVTRCVKGVQVTDAQAKNMAQQKKGTRKIILLR